ncbi:MAG: hypothetical protein HY774_20975 [Acidobacteria bacterium]|nr:hypothetical protein [Acidobacteriota bacterium]
MSRWSASLWTRHHRMRISSRLPPPGQPPPTAAAGWAGKGWGATGSQGSKTHPGLRAGTQFLS